MNQFNTFNESRATSEKGGGGLGDLSTTINKGLGCTATRFCSFTFFAARKKTMLKKKRNPSFERLAINFKTFHKNGLHRSIDQWQKSLLNR